MVLILPLLENKLLIDLTQPFFLKKISAATYKTEL
jgi:hypothetical protein